jgi:hypothetical protein
MDERKYLTAEEVSERYRGEISVGTLRNWRSMRVGPTFIKIGKAVLYAIDDLEAWDQKNMVTCRASKRLNTDAPDALARRRPDDAGDRRGGASARHRRARSSHRRQGRPRQPEGAEADLSLSARAPVARKQVPGIRVAACRTSSLMLYRNITSAGDTSSCPMLRDFDGSEDP